MEKVIYCNDGSLVAMIARTNKSKKWDLFGISEIRGMGNADYNKKLFDFDFIEVVPLNSYCGISYVCLNKDHKWGLLEVKDSETAHCEWNIFADFIYDDIDYMLKEMKVERNEFGIKSNEEFTEIVDIVQNILTNNNEWENRFAAYAESIKKNKQSIIEARKKFHTWKNFSTYTSIGKVATKNKSIIFDLRYKGQSVANLKIDNKKVKIKIDNKNKKYFSTTQNADTYIDWNSGDAKKFRSDFSKSLDRNDNGKGNEEHRIENLLLKEFSKKIGADKKLRDIQPVVMFKKNGLYYQMTTPISASKSSIKYSGQSGGGIDILARSNGKLCVIEVKDENKPSEPPTVVIKQAIAYATFISRLLRSDSGLDWWNIFGFEKKNLPQNLIINVVAAMPFPKDNSIPDFENLVIEIKSLSVILKLHYIYFKEGKEEGKKDKKITEIKTSLSSRFS